MQTIEIRRELSDQFFYDIMCTMVESGSHALWYWGTAINIDRVNGEYVSITVREGNEDEPVDDGAEAVVNPESIAAALQVILRESPFDDHLMGFIRRAVLEEDAGDIDAIGADVIAQWVVMEEVRYS